MKKGGSFIVVDEYWLDTCIEDMVWREFRQHMLDSYKKWGANPFVPRDLPYWLKLEGFSDIKGSIEIYSPITIGIDKFLALILTVPALIEKIVPGIWGKAYLKKLERWVEEIIRTGKLDPFITIAHIIAKKP